MENDYCSEDEWVADANVVLTISMHIGCKTLKLLQYKLFFICVQILPLDYRMVY
jgi:hypothetical protein